MPDPETPYVALSEQPRFHERVLRDPRVFGGVAVACAAGLAFGLLMKPTLGDQPRAKQASARVVEIPKEPGYGLDIVVTPQRAQPLPVASTPLPAPVYETPAAPVVRASAPEPEAETEAERPMRRTSSRPAARPSFNCDYARTVSERMVCNDRDLAAADRRLAQAYARAVRAGVPHRVLRRQQDVWLQAREEAAHDHPDAVAEVYEARIAELRDLAYDAY